MLVTFYQLTKRPNSTKTVDKSTQYWFSVDVELKEPCTTSNPSFTLHLEPGGNRVFVWPANIAASGGPDSAIPADLTSYTHVDMQNLYFRCPIYRISNIEIDNTTATVYLKPDLLASYRSSILNSTQFVSRISDIAKCDRTLVDTLPVAENRYKYSYYNSALNKVFNNGYENGSYVLGVINDSPTVGSVCYYMFQNINALQELLTYLMSDVNWASITDISEELAKTLINPMQYIVSCKYFPLNIDYYETDGEPVYQNVKVGFWTTPVKAFKMLDYSTSISGTH